MEGGTARCDASPPSAAASSSEGFFIRALTARSNPPSLVFLLFLSRASPPLWLRLAPLSVRGFLLFLLGAVAVWPRSAQSSSSPAGKPTERERGREGGSGGGRERKRRRREGGGGSVVLMLQKKREEGGRRGGAMRRGWGGSAHASTPSTLHLYLLLLPLLPSPSSPLRSSALFPPPPPPLSPPSSLSVFCVGVSRPPSLPPAAAGRCVWFQVNEDQGGRGGGGGQSVHSVCPYMWGGGGHI